MGNQNLQFFSTVRIQSQEFQDRRYSKFAHTTNSNLGNTTGGETVLPERTEIHGWTLQQHEFDFQVSNIHIEFITNGITYYDYTHVSNSSAIVEFDFSVIGSNTLVSPAGDPPLIMEEGETLGIRIFDNVNRLNQSDRWGFSSSVWGIRLPT